MSPTTIVLSRHGQTVWHQSNRYAGVSDVDMTDQGHSQATALAAWARHERPDVVISSPVRRAMETARPAAEAIGQELQVEPELREMSFGVAEGRTMAELRETDPGMTARFVADPVNHHFPAGENPAEVAARGAATLVRLAGDYPARTVLVVAHNTLLRLTLCQLLGINISSYRIVFPRLDNGTLTHISIDGQGDPVTSLLSFNVPLPPAQPTESH